MTASWGNRTPFVRTPLPPNAHWTVHWLFFFHNISRWTAATRDQSRSHPAKCLIQTEWAFIWFWVIRSFRLDKYFILSEWAICENHSNHFLLFIYWRKLKIEMWCSDLAVSNFNKLWSWFTLIFLIIRWISRLI